MRTTFLPQYLIHELVRMFRPLFQGCKINSSNVDKEEWFAAREVARLDCGVVRLSFFDIPFQPRFLLHECIMKSTRLDNRTVERSSWLQEAGWRAERTTAHCENAILPLGLLPGLGRQSILPLGLLPGLGRQSGHDLTESDVGSDQGGLASIASWQCIEPRRKFPHASGGRSRLRWRFQELLRRNLRHQDGTGTQDDNIDSRRQSPIWLAARPYRRDTSPLPGP